MQRAMSFCEFCPSVLAQEELSLSKPAVCLFVCLLAGYLSWNNTEKGSWFIQSLHQMMNKYGGGGEMEFVRLLTRVNRQVAYEYESQTSEPHTTRMKQMPSIVSMLTKDLYLTPKQQISQAVI